MNPLFLVFLLGILAVAVLLARIEVRALKNSWTQKPPQAWHAGDRLRRLKWLKRVLLMGVIGVLAVNAGGPS